MHWWRSRTPRLFPSCICLKEHPPHPAPTSTTAPPLKHEEHNQNEKQETSAPDLCLARTSSGCPRLSMGTPHWRAQASCVTQNGAADWLSNFYTLSLSLFPTRSPASVAVVTSPKASWPRSPWMERVSSGRTKSRTTTTRNGAATRTAWTNPPQKHRDVCLQVLGWKQPLRHRCAPKTSQVSPMLLF